MVSIFRTLLYNPEYHPYVIMVHDSLLSPSKFEAKAPKASQSVVSMVCVAGSPEGLTATCIKRQNGCSICRKAKVVGCGSPKPEALNA